jgi:SNF2 family DNA or RNA helicase
MTNDSRHFDEPTLRALKTIKYHGQHRQLAIKDVGAADIVITTYHTLASDFAGTKSVLRNLEWYRLVLDEGIQALLSMKLSLTRDHSSYHKTAGYRALPVRC